MSSSQAKLTLRAPPHRNFIQGYPGIPAGQGRTAAHIAGSIEVRLGGKGLKTSWLRIELRKIESTPTGENWGELIGKGPIEVWSASGSAEQDAEGKWDIIQTADFPFSIAIPEGLPPTARLDKQVGISYEMVSSLCVKSKKGLLRKESTSSIFQSTHPISIEKHELHSTWPIYSVPDDHEQMVNQVVARVYRRQTCFGPGDKVEIRVILTSKNVAPVKLKSVAFSIKETVTFRGNRRGSRMLGGATKTANQRTETIAHKTQNLGLKIYKGDVKTYDLSLVFPKAHALMTIQTAKHIEVSYTMRVYVDGKNPIIIDHLPLTITTVPKTVSASIVPQIGFVPGLSAPIDSAESLRYGEEIQRPQSVGSQRPQRTGGFVQQQPTIPEQRPLAARSQSYASEVTQYPSDAGYQANNLQRRDTMMTQATAYSGPGLAGRGVPGQMYGAEGAFGQPFGQGAGPVRSAFAGPASIYEGRELGPEENRALQHHSQGNHLGEVFRNTDVLPSVNASHTHRANSPPRNEARMSVQGRMPQRQGGDTSQYSSAPPSGSEAAELEKERLYERARIQAERNQRLAAAAAASSSASSSGGLAAFNEGNGPVTGLAAFNEPSASRSGHDDSGASAVDEKQRLYDRARREAQRNQDSYAAGQSLSRGQTPSNSNKNAAAFEAATGASGVGYAAMALMGSNSRSPSPTSSLSTTTGTISAAPRNNVASPAPTSARPAAFASAEQEKSRLYEAAAAQRDGQLASPAGQGMVNRSSNPNGVASSTANGYPSAEDEKKRYAAAKAATDQRLQQGQDSSSSAAAASYGPEVPSYEAVMAAGSSSNARSSAQYPSAEEEKRRLYEQAKAEVDAGQRGGGASTTTAAPVMAASSSATAQGNGRAAYPSAEEEKRRLHEQARAEVEAQQPGSSVPLNKRVASTNGTPMAPGTPSNATASRAYPSAEEEKKQLYEKARAEVEGNQRGASIPAHQRVVPRDQSPAVTSAASVEDEKAQMKRYYEAQDAVQRHQDGNAGGSSSAAAAAAAPVIARPSPSYASGYRSPDLRHVTNNVSSGSSSGSSGAPPIPGAFPGTTKPTPSSNLNPNSTSNRHVSQPILSGYAPYSYTASSAAYESRPIASSTSTTASSAADPYAPRIASADWHELDDDDDDDADGGGEDQRTSFSALSLGGIGGSSRSTSSGGVGGGGPPPPLPPKTPLGSGYGIR